MHLELMAQDLPAVEDLQKEVAQGVMELTRLNREFRERHDRGIAATPEQIRHRRQLRAEHTGKLALLKTMGKHKYGHAPDPHRRARAVQYSW